MARPAGARRVCALLPSARRCLPINAIVPGARVYTPFSLPLERIPFSLYGVLGYGAFDGYIGPIWLSTCGDYDDDDFCGSRLWGLDGCIWVRLGGGVTGRVREVTRRCAFSDRLTVFSRGGCGY